MDWYSLKKYIFYMWYFQFSKIGNEVNFFIHDSTCSIFTTFVFYHTHPHTHFPHFPFANFHIFSLTLFYALVIELQTNIVWWCRYFIRNLMCTPAAVIRNIKNIYIILYVCTACCLLNEGAFFLVFHFGCFVYCGGGIF